MKLPPSWKSLAGELEKDYFRELAAFVAEERQSHSVYPPVSQVFAALQATPPDKVKVLLLGQDPYHGAGQAHGLCFSVQRNVPLPPSLKNIYRELADDTGCEIPAHGDLTSWAQQGVLMLNTVLTVRANEANSHRKRGWERFTDQVIRHVSDGAQPVVFVFWGKPAQKKKKLVDLARHRVIESPHPSPLSAHRGFLGSRPFSQINEFLTASGVSPVDWSLP